MHDSHRGLVPDPLAPLHDPLILILAAGLQRTIRRQFLPAGSLQLTTVKRRKKANIRKEKKKKKKKQKKARYPYADVLVSHVYRAPCKGLRKRRNPKQ